MTADDRSVLIVYLPFPYRTLFLVDTHAHGEYGAIVAITPGFRAIEFGDWIAREVFPAPSGGGYPWDSEDPELPRCFDLAVIVHENHFLYGEARGKSTESDKKGMMVKESIQPGKPGGSQVGTNRSTSKKD